MSLKSQRRLAADLLGGGLNRVWIDPEDIDRVQSAITRDEVKKLIREGSISLLAKTGDSRGPSSGLPTSTSSFRSQRRTSGGILLEHRHPRESLRSLAGRVELGICLRRI